MNARHAFLRVCRALPLAAYLLPYPSLYLPLPPRLCHISERPYAESVLRARHAYPHQVFRLGPGPRPARTRVGSLSANSPLRSKYGAPAFFWALYSRVFRALRLACLYGAALIVPCGIRCLNQVPVQKNMFYMTRYYVIVLCCRLLPAAKRVLAAALLQLNVRAPSAPPYGKAAVGSRSEPTVQS